MRAALESGGGGGDAVATVMDARVSKNLLLLRALSDAIATSIHPAAQRFANNFATLAILQRQAPVAVRQAIAYPLVGSWLAICVRKLRATRQFDDDCAKDLDHFGGVVLAAAARAGLAVQVVARLDDGAIAVPGFGRLHANQKGSGPACVSYDGSGGSWDMIRKVILSHNDHRLFVTIDDMDPYRNPTGLAAAERMSPTEFTKWHTGLSASWETLVHHHPTAAQELANGLKVLVPLSRNDRGGDVSATLSSAAGAISLSLPADIQTLSAALIHELQHTKLNCLFDLMASEEHASDRHYSPWRLDPRPLWGILHGAYAFIGVAEFWAREANNPSADGRLASFEFARISQEVRQGLQTLNRAEALRSVDRPIIEGLSGRVDGWTAPVPTNYMRMAYDLERGNYARWRLLNDPASSTTFRTDFTDFRLAAARAVVTGSSSDDWPELLLASGRYREAVDLYAQQVEQQSTELGAWVGLSVAARALGGDGLLVTRPELAQHKFAELLSAGTSPIDALVDVGLPR